MTNKIRFMQYQGKRNIIRMFRMVLCVIIAAFLTVSAGFAQSGTMDTNVTWSVANRVLTIKPATGDSGTISENRTTAADWPWHNQRSSITKVSIEGSITVSNSTAYMFQGLSNVTSFEGLDNLKVSQVKNMSYMFAGCSSLTNLDLSSFGTLSKLTTVQGFLAGCDSLKNLNMDGLDISAVRETSGWARVWWAQDANDNNYIENRVLPSLEKLSAKNSKIWLVRHDVKASSGTSYFSMGSEGRKSSRFPYMMCHQSDGNEICNRMWFTPDVVATKAPAHMQYNAGKILLNHREWIDLITDRWLTTNDSMIQGKNNQEGPDWTTNPNVAANIGGTSENDYTDVYWNSTKGHTNIHGAGFLAPGVYERTNEENTYWDELPKTYYRIVGLGNTMPDVTINGQSVENNKVYKDLEVTAANNKITINSKKMDASVIQNYDNYTLTFDPIDIIYKDAVKDIYGTTKNLKLTIKGVKFTNQNQIPVQTSGSQTSNYVQSNDQWYRKLFEITKDSVLFNNYLYRGNNKMTKKNSGVEVDFTIEVVDAEPNTTILFYLTDLDVEHKQTDSTRWAGISYGEDSEGIKLLDGNDLNGITFAKHTGLEIRDIIEDDRLTGKWILGTGGDQRTPWSSVYVRAHADGAHYVWTNGVGCTTSMLENTEDFPELDPVLVLPEARKLLDGAAPKDAYFKAFKFKVEDAKDVVHQVQISGLDPLTNQEAPLSSVNPDGTHTNRGDDIYFGFLQFAAPKEPPHKAAYVYKVTEILGNNTDIIYDTGTVFYAQVIITAPVTEEELAKGTRADIYMGEQHCNKDGSNCGDIIWDRDIPVTVWSSDIRDAKSQTAVLDCGSQHEVLMDANGKQFYRHDGKFWSYPEKTELQPVSSVDSDTHHQVSCPGIFDSLDVYEDSNGVEYVHDETNDKYYSPFCLELQEGIDVWPDHADDPVIEKLVTSVPKREGKSGKGNIVYQTEDEIPVDYYLHEEHYYSVIGTLMPVSGRFNPKDTDKIVYVNEEILEEKATGRKFYYSENQYFLYGTDPLGELQEHDKFDLADTTIDTSDIPVSGTFRNYTKNTLTIEKRTVEDKEGSFDFTVRFDNNFDIGSNCEFREPEQGTIVKAEDWSENYNLWKFSLQNGQELIIHKIPQNTKYTVTELPSKDGFSFVSVDNDRNSSYSVSGTIDPNTPAEHVFDNALTEVTVEKKIIGANKAFSFTAKLEISGLFPNEQFYYGIKDQLSPGTADTDGKAEVSLTFSLSDQQKAVLIVPYGANVTITEETASGYTTHVHKKIDESEPIADNSITLKNVKEDTAVLFTNSQQTEKISISKEVHGNAASETKYFKFDVHFKQAGAGTVLTLDMSEAEIAPEQTEDTVYPSAEMREANSRDDDPNTPGQQIICSGDHGEVDFTLYLCHGQSVEITGIPYDTGYSVQEDNEDYTPEVRIRGDTMTDDENLPEPIIDTSEKNFVEDLSLTKDAEIEFRNSRYKEDPEPEPEPEPEKLTFFRLDIPLPETGFSALRPQVLAEKPLGLNYQPLGWTIQIPELSLQTELVRVPVADGKYQVTWLGNSAGLLEGTALPGEGRALIAGHNHLNTTEAGPFALLRELDMNDRVFVLSPSGELRIYSVYANEKIAEDDTAGLERIANAHENSLTFITCEDERVDGGYAARRIVAAREITN